MRKVLIGLGAVILASCGGGGGGTDTGTTGGIGSGSGSGSSIYVRVEEVSVDKSSISVGDSFTISWRVSYGGTMYWVKGYISDSESVPASAGNYNIFYKNCGSGSLYSCNETGSVTCTYVNNLDGVPVIDCGVYTRSIPITGNGFVVLQACTLNTDLSEICDTKATPLTIR